ncbi:MAG: hypothetical protein EOP48_02495 [Sphingobacteriales bacterium]|nr:MAG: hypothetical protein EOP48_02495 [Sphingobacteriales bacterium]
MKRFLTVILVTFFCGACYAQHKIELNLTKGQVYEQKMSLVMAIKQTINNTDIVINMTINGTTAFTVTDVKDGVYDIDVAYKSLGIKTEMPGIRTISFDSEKEDNNDTVSTSLRMMKDKPFHMKMNKQGKLLAVSNVAHLYSSIFDKFPNLSPAQKQKIQGQLESSFGEKAFKNNLGNMMAFFPQSAISKGGKWTVKNSVASANMDMQMDNSYTLDDVTANQYLVSGVSQMTSPNTGAPTMINGMSAKSDITGNVTTSMKINKKSGWLEESISNMSLKGVISFEANDKMPNGMTIPMEISGKTTITAN